MTIINVGDSRFWFGRTSEGAVGDAGPYSDTEFSNTLKQLLPYATDPHTGIIQGSAYSASGGPLAAYNALKVTVTNPVSNAVQIQPGAALALGRHYSLDTAQNQTITANGSGNPRIDAIVLRVDTTGQTVRPYYLQGTPAVSPVVPTITANDVPLAYIAVASGFASIAATDIFDARQFIAPDRFSVPFESGGSPGATFEDGAPLRPDGGAFGGTPSAVLGDHRVYGVNERYTVLGSNDPTRMVTHGVALVEVTGATTPGNYLEQSATSGRARPTTTPEHAFGIALQAATTAGDKVLALISPSIPNNPAYVRAIDQQTSGTNGGTFTSGAWQTRTLNTLTDPNGIASLGSNRVTLPAGSYRAIVSAPAYRVNGHKCRLQNITAGTTLDVGTSEYSPNAVDSATSRSIINTRFTLASASAIEVQHQCTTTQATTGFGLPTSIATIAEIYTVVEFMRLLT